MKTHGLMIKYCRMKILSFAYYKRVFNPPLNDENLIEVTNTIKTRYRRTPGTKKMCACNVVVSITR